MGIISEFVEVRWNNRIKAHYLSKGYQFTKLGDEFQVKIKDLTFGSHSYIKCTCDDCGKESNITYNNYNKCIKPNGKYYCYSCSMLLFGTSKKIKTHLKNSISFEHWCYNNLDKDKVNEIMLRWDYEKNQCSPNEITFKSEGIDGNGYWFKCSKHSNHESELKRIASYTSGGGSLECTKCNTIAYTHPYLVKYFVNQLDVYNYSYGSKNKLLCKCPNCGYEKRITPNKLSRQGFGCNRCSDGISYPNKIMFSLLNQLGIKFETEKSFPWSKNARYDFYFMIEKSEYIVEIDGGWHYIDNKLSGQTKEQSALIDSAKDNLAINQDVMVIRIDCRESNLEFIKNNILNSCLSLIFNLDNIDWDKCENHALSSYIKKSCDIWNSGIKSLKEISEIMNLHPVTISSYLQKGAKINLCDYDYKKHLCSKVICLNTDIIFNSINNASNTYGVLRTGISACVRKKAKSAGKHPVTGEPLRWMYFNEYEKLNSISA